jgi:fused signal recognition particle receptor
MFNWFRRNNKAKQEESPTTPQTQEITKTESPELATEAQPQSQSQSQEDYLAWAKAAYQNIQEKKGKEQLPSKILETPTKEETKEIVVEKTLKEEIVETKSTSEILETPTTDEIIPEETSLEITTETEPISEIVETPEATPQEAITETPANAPAWMQKSQGLEKLKETAIAEPEPQLDEDFVWSAKVLAQQGRTPDDVSQEEINWLTKLRQGLGKTRRGLIVQLKAVVGQGPLNKAAVEEIEALLLQADIGIEATDYIIETLQAKLKEEALPPEQAIAYLKTILQEILDKPLQGQNNQDFIPEPDVLNIWLLTGVNGAGKTTTIGKLTNLAKTSGYNCLIAAADTFRAAAVEQVKVWGERTNTEVIANPGQNTDPAAVVYDAITSAKSRQTDLLLVDTAGRLQNKKNLMDELTKIRRVVDKNAPNARIESLLVIDATLGQNSLYQAQVFSEAAQLSGVVLTKLDGSAKGGVALAIAKQLNLPIRFIGVGEGIEDLRPFSSYEFVEALLNG